MNLTPQECNILLDVARNAIRAALRGESSPPLDTQDAALHRPAGCFVSLHAQSTHALRGCVGKMEAVDPLIVTVRDTAASVLYDPRFTAEPVTMEELPTLEIEISVLAPLRPAAGPLDFDPLNDGILLTIGDRSGVFLPQVARETGWTREQLLDRLCTEKLNLPALLWRHPPARLQVFSTLILGPVPF